MLHAVSLRLQCRQYPHLSWQGYQRVGLIFYMDVRHHYSNAARTVETQQCPEEFKEDVWLQVTTTYKVHSTDGGNLKFSDDVTGWAGKPKSGRLCDGIDTSQVSKITASDAFYNNVHQSVSKHAAVRFYTTNCSPRLPRCYSRGFGFKSAHCLLPENRQLPLVQGVRHSV